jgi:hypothetical protein
MMGMYHELASLVIMSIQIASCPLLVYGRYLLPLQI